MVGLRMNEGVDEEKAGWMKKYVIDGRGTNGWLYKTPSATGEHKDECNSARILRQRREEIRVSGNFSVGLKGRFK